MILTTGKEHDPKEVNNYLRSFIPTRKDDIQTAASIRGLFSPLSSYLRHIFLSGFNLSASTSDADLIDIFTGTLEKSKQFKQVTSELESHQLQLGAQMVDEAISAGALDKEDREPWVKLAAVNLETAKRLIYHKYEDRLEADKLMKLSGHQLYMEGKLERLKELSDSGFELKYQEHLSYNHRNPDNYHFNRNQVQAVPENELEVLMKLSADELYFEEGKMERLKDLNFGHFKLMYKEIFKVEYSASRK